MKHIFCFLLMFMCLSCNDNEYDCTITYNIYYPGKTVTKTRNFKGDRYKLNADDGVTYLWAGRQLIGDCLEKTTAPIEVIEFVKK